MQFVVALLIPFILEVHSQLIVSTSDFWHKFDAFSDRSYVPLVRSSTFSDMVATNILNHIDMATSVEYML